MPAGSSSVHCRASDCVFPACCFQGYRESPWKALTVISEYLALGSCLLKVATILHILFPIPTPEGQMPQNSVLPGNSVFAFAVTNATFSFPTGLALCVSPHCNALLHLCHYWHAGKILHSFILAVSSLALLRLQVVAASTAGAVIWDEAKALLVWCQVN